MKNPGRKDSFFSKGGLVLLYLKLLSQPLCLLLKYLISYLLYVFNFSVMYICLIFWWILNSLKSEPNLSPFLIYYTQISDATEDFYE